MSNFLLFVQLHILCAGQKKKIETIGQKKAITEMVPDPIWAPDFFGPQEIWARRNLGPEKFGPGEISSPRSLEPA